LSAAPIWKPTPSFETGLAAYRSNDLDLAESVLSELVDQDPCHVEARHVLALAQRDKGLPHPAAENLAEVLRCQNNNAEAWSNYGAVLRECGRLTEAAEALQTSTILEPTNPVSWNNLGTVLLDLGDSKRASDCFTQSLALKPDYAEALINLSRVMFEAGKLGEARQLARSAVALAPGRAEAYNRMSFFQAAIGDLEGSLSSLESARRAEPDNDRVASNHLLRSLGSDRLSAAEVCNLAGQWGARHPRVPDMQPRRPETIKRLGMVSGDFRRHPVGFFLAHVIEELADQVEVFCYSSVPGRDDVTDRIDSAAAGWRCIHRIPAQDAAQAIAEDQIDVLLDLSGHTGDNRLDVFALRPAPVQATWLGYSGTTGLPQMDAILVDQTLVPENQEEFYTERIARLPDCFLCFEPTSHVPNVVTPEGPTVFGVFNNPGKYSETCYRMWAKILLATEGSVIAFKYHHSHDPVAQKHVAGRLEDYGIGRDRVKFVPHLAHSEHLDFLSKVHIALDTFPYSGATTTFDCVWSGLPVVTLAGDRYSSRMSASILAALGRTETVTCTEDEYVQMAVRLASDPLALASAREGLRDALVASQLCDAPRFAAALLETLTGLL